MHAAPRYLSSDEAPSVCGSEIRQHMFRETAAGGSLRFAIDGDAQGGIVIRVMPSKEDGQRVRRRPTFDDQPYERGLLGRAFGMRQPPERRIPKMWPGMRPGHRRAEARQRLEDRDAQADAAAALQRPRVVAR